MAYCETKCTIQMHAGYSYVQTSCTPDFHRQERDIKKLKRERIKKKRRRVKQHCKVCGCIKSKMQWFSVGVGGGRGRGAARKGCELFWLQTARWSAGTWSTKVAQQEGNAGIFMTAKECRGGGNLEITFNIQWGEQHISKQRVWIKLTNIFNPITLWLWFKNFVMG